MGNRGPGGQPNFWICGRCHTPNPAAVYLTLCVACGGPRSGAPSPTRPEPTARPDPVRRPSRPLAATAVGYSLVVLLTLVLARAVGDAWWPGSLVRLGPRWIMLVPTVPLGIWAWRRRRPWVGALLAIDALAVAGPLMGFVVPLGRGAGGPGGMGLRIMTFNRGVDPIDVPRFLRFLERQKVDVVCFQEPGKDPALGAFFAQAGWHRDGSGAIASRYPIAEPRPRLPERNEDGGRYTALLDRALIEGTGGRRFLVGSVHMPTLRPGFQGLLSGDAGALGRMLDWWASELGRVADTILESRKYPILLGGDFNNGIDASGFGRLLGPGAFRSAFDRAGLGWGYTRPSALPWARIDHILVGDEWQVVACWVGPSFGSDHRSLVAEVWLPPGRDGGE